MRAPALLAVVIGLAASVASSPFVSSSTGGPCSSDDDCRRDFAACLGGFCSGAGTCADCLEGEECVREERDFLLFTDIDERCFQTCNDNEDCPATWACADGLCDYPPPDAPAVTRPDGEVFVGDEVDVQLVRPERALAIESIEWSASPEGAATVVASNDEGARVRFDLGTLVSVGASYQDVEGRTFFAVVELDVRARAGDRCRATEACVDPETVCTGTTPRCFVPLDVVIERAPADATTAVVQTFSARVLAGDDAGLAYAWLVDGAAPADDGAASIDVAFEAGGEHTVRLDVTNAAGLSDAAELDVELCAVSGDLCPSFRDCCGGDTASCADDGTGVDRCL